MLRELNGVLQYLDMTAAKETTLNEVGEMLGYVVENMATKDDIKDTATNVISPPSAIRSRVSSET